MTDPGLNERGWRDVLEEWPRRVAPLAVITAALLAFALLAARNQLVPPDWSDGVDVAEWEIVASLAVAFFFLFLSLSNVQRFLSIIQRRVIIFPLAGLVAASIYRLGMHQFGGFDEGLDVHAATYYAHGLRPFVDFPCSLPPFFMAGIRAATLVLDFRWCSLILLQALFGGVSTLWIYFLMEQTGLGCGWSLLLVTVFELSTTVVCPFWWYNNSCYVAVALLMLSSLAVLEARSWLPWLSLSLAMAMVLTSKPNALVAGAMVLALCGRGRWVRLAVAAAAALLVAWLLCRAAQMPLLPTLHAYSEVARLRGNPLALTPFKGMRALPRVYESALVVLSLGAFALAFARRCRAAEWRAVAICGIGGCTALMMVATNAEPKYSDLSVLLLATALLVLHPWRSERTAAASGMLLPALLALFLAASGYFAVSHHRILTIGPGMYYERLPVHTIEQGYFKGMEAAPRFELVMEQTANLLAANPGAKVFFGPRMEFGYAAFHLPPTQHMPLLWDAGTLFPKEAVTAMIRDFQNEDPDLLILLKDDYTHMAHMEFYLRNTPTYERDDEYSQLTVYVRRHEVPVTRINVTPTVRP